MTFVVGADVALRDLPPDFGWAVTVTVIRDPLYFAAILYVAWVAPRMRWPLRYHCLVKTSPDCPHVPVVEAKRRPTLA